jgi:hypothetical protein
MSDAAIRTLDREARQGFPRLRGARISGSIPVNQILLNEIAATSGVVSNVRILDGNRVGATVWGVPVQATIIHVDSALTVTVQLDVPWWAAVVTRLIAVAPQVRRDDRGHLHIAVGMFGPVSAYRHLLKHLSAIGVRTHPGTLIVDFQLAVGGLE